MKWNFGMMTDQIYTHVLAQGDPLDGVRHINASAILRDITEPPRFPYDVKKMHVDRALHDVLVASYGVEESHIERIRGDAARLEDPVLVMEWPGGEHQTIIDGAHRVVSRFRRGDTFALSIWVKFEDIQDYLVTDIPRPIEVLMLDFTKEHRPA